MAKTTTIKSGFYYLTDGNEKTIPLTTSFTPPASCFKDSPTDKFTYIDSQTSAIFNAFYLIGVWDASLPTTVDTNFKVAPFAKCYPPDFESIRAHRTYYEPGVCPDSHTMATTTVEWINGERNWFGACCLPGWVHIPPSPKARLKADSNSPALRDLTALGVCTTLFPNAKAPNSKELVIAPAISVRWRDHDHFNLLGIHPPTPTPDPTDLNSTSSPTITVLVTAASTGFAPATKSPDPTTRNLGIGLGIVLALLFLSVLTLSYLLHRRRLRRLRTPPSDSLSSDWPPPLAPFDTKPRPFHSHSTTKLTGRDLLSRPLPALPPLHFHGHIVRERTSAPALVRVDRGGNQLREAVSCGDFVGRGMGRGMEGRPVQGMFELEAREGGMEGGMF